MSLITIHHLHIHTDGADPQVLSRLEQILERVSHMLTQEQLKAAVQQAVGEEAAEVAARITALEERIAQLQNGETITEATRDEILAMVRGIFTPPAA
jgi:cell division protein FtsB